MYIQHSGIVLTALRLHKFLIYMERISPTIVHHMQYY